MVHPVELSLICYMMLRKGQLRKAEYLGGGKKQGWLNLYLDEVLDQSKSPRDTLMLLNSMISGDKAETLKLDSIAQRCGLPLHEVSDLLEYLERARIVIKEVEYA